VEIDIKGLSKSYNGVLARDSLDLGVSSGEVMGILGPNGAGKTTLISILSTTIVPTRGSIKLAETDITAAPEKAKPVVGIVPQEISLYNDLTVEENIIFFSRMYGVPGKTLAENARRLLSFAGLDARRRDPVKTLSGGMKRRLNFVCGLVNSPRILLLDEPTVGVDPQSREKIYDMVRHLRGEGVTTVVATHHIFEAEALCDRIAIVDGGRIVMVHSVPEYRAMFAEKLGPDRITMENIFLHITGKELRD